MNASFATWPSHRWKLKTGDEADIQFLLITSVAIWAAAKKLVTAKARTHFYKSLVHKFMLGVLYFFRWTGRDPSTYDIGVKKSPTRANTSGRRYRF